MIILMRYPVFQEDEGRYEQIGQYKDLPSAHKKIEEMCKTGYFSERDFFTMEVK